MNKSSVPSKEFKEDLRKVAQQELRFFREMTARVAAVSTIILNKGNIWATS